MNYSGLYRAVVSNVNDPEKMGRIKVVIPELLGDKAESTWCMPCIPVCYDDGGDFCLPKLKETVWIAFEGGSINKPVYLGNWWSPNQTPCKKDYNTKVRVISFDKCSIVMEGDKISVIGDVDVTNISVNGKSLKQYIKEVVEEISNA